MLILASAAASLALFAPLVALNPQPEPPGRTAHVSGFVTVELNPQPEPPGKAKSVAAGYVKTQLPVLEAAKRVELNPQPEPPGIVTDARVLLPPGPCRTILVTVETEGARAPFTAHAVDTTERGKCAFDVPTPGAKAGSRAAVKFSRDRDR